MSPTRLFWFISIGLIALVDALAFFWSWSFLWLHVVVLPLFFMGVRDLTQKKRAILRNFPVVGRLRYLMESIRPELQQYFVESNLDGRPINRETRSVVYQRAKGELQTLPFGTQRDVYEEGYEWVNHSVFPKSVNEKNLCVTIGGPDCQKPYTASLMNISAMSYGSLSQPAIQALNQGAKMGGFYHNTGEGSVSPYHLESGGDLVWQIGTGYFGCRTKEGLFDEEAFKKVALGETVKMIEIKLSQGAKPGHGGILPAGKITPEIAAIRGVPLGQDVLSPPCHSAFEGPAGLVQFIKKLRDLSGGKPVGFKLCVGKLEDFLDIIEQMKIQNITPDFITVDGSEGGTGAAPLEFSNNLGMPLKDGLSFVNKSLKEAGLRDRIKLIASGKVFTAFQLISTLALGADLVNSARGMMLALGCIQALRCNSNHCPAGVATNNPDLTKGLDVPLKAQRVFQYHKDTLKVVAEILGAMGLTHQSELKPHMVKRRFNDLGVKTYEEIYYL